MSPPYPTLPTSSPKLSILSPKPGSLLMPLPTPQGAAGAALHPDALLCRRHGGHREAGCSGMGPGPGSAVLPLPGVPPCRWLARIPVAPLLSLGRRITAFIRAMCEDMPTQQRASAPAAGSGRICGSPGHCGWPGEGGTAQLSPEEETPLLRG